MRYVTSQSTRQKVKGRDSILVLLAEQGKGAVDASIKWIDCLGTRVEVPRLLSLASLFLLLHLCQTILRLGVNEQILMLRLHLA